MKNFIISALLACSQAVRITDDMPAVARSYNADNEPVLDTFRIQSNDELLMQIKDDKPAVARSYNFDNEPIAEPFKIQNNDELLIDLDVTRDVDALIQINASTIHWHEGKQAKAETNHCSNDSKATGKLESCDQEYNSAWNTHSSAVTGTPS